MVATLCRSARLSRGGKYPHFHYCTEQSFLCSIVTPTCIVLLFCLNHFIGVLPYAVYVKQFKGNSSKNCTYVPDAEWYKVKHFRRPAIARPSVDSESSVLYLKPYVALRRLSIKLLWGKTSQDLAS